MPEVKRNDTTLHYELHGPQEGPTVVFSNSLGSTLHLWDEVLDHLPRNLRILRYDMRGHGRSSIPDGPYAMGQLVSDAAAVCDAANVRDAVFVGLSVGGMVAQGLAVKRADVVRAIVLSCTAAKIGNPKFWEDRIALIRQQGMKAISDDIMQRWFGKAFYNGPEMPRWKSMFEANDITGYTGVCAAIAGTDFYTPTSGLRIPTLGIAGAEDGTTPPDLVRETVDLIPGSKFALMRGVGHLPCVEQPQTYAKHLTAFLKGIGHV